jgi:nucleotide-binding universal stress UspA family protein
MRLLVAYDGSDGAKAAIDDLLFAGLPQDAEATTLAVIDGRTLAKAEAQEATAGGDPKRGTPGTLEVCNAVAEEGAKRLRGHFPKWAVTAEVSVGAPAWKIIERAEADGGVDLIVTGSRGFGELKRLLFGSVAHHVVTQATCPVRIGRPRRGPDRAGGDQHLRVVLGDDGSPDAQAALRSVADRRWPSGTRILVATFETDVQTRLSNWTPNTVWGGDPIMMDSDAIAERPAIRVAARAAEFLKIACPGASVSTLVRPHDPKYGLLDVADTWEGAGADCVFVGATGVRGIARFLVGSVSTTVALNAPCSVEIVHRKAASPQPPG